MVVVGISAIIRTRREIQCLPEAGLFLGVLLLLASDHLSSLFFYILKFPFFNLVFVEILTYLYGKLI